MKVKRNILLLFLAMGLSLPSMALRERLAESDPVPDTVRIGTYIISVHDINFHEKEYTIRFWLWLLYDNPDFDFVKQIDIPNAKSFDRPDIIVDSIDGKAWVMMRMKCEMKQNWNVDDFPFDSQHLKVQIENTLFDKNSLVFIPDEKGSTFDKELTIDGWKISDFKVTTHVNDYETAFGFPHADKQYSEYHAFNIEMDIERDALGLFLKIFIGMYISFLISAISFTPHPSELEPRFGLPVGGLFAAVGNKYIIDSILPESSTFSLVDTLHTLTFLAIFATLLISAYVLKLHDKGNTEKALRMNKRLSWTIVLLYFGLNAFIVVKAIL